MRLKREQGFTFLELLLVLSVVIVLTAVILPFSSSKLQETSEEDALEAFMNVVHEAQLAAITQQTRKTVYFKEAGTAYFVKTENEEGVLRGKFPAGMRQAENTAMKEVVFLSTGRIAMNGTMTIYMKSRGNLRIRFQFERGRMLIDG